MWETMHGSKLLMNTMSRQACKVYQRTAMQYISYLSSPLIPTASAMSLLSRSMLLADGYMVHSLHKLHAINLIISTVCEPAWAIHLRFLNGLIVASCLQLVALEFFSTELLLAHSAVYSWAAAHLPAVPLAVDTIQALAISVQQLLLHGWGHAIVVALVTVFISKNCTLNTAQCISPSKSKDFLT